MMYVILSIVVYVTACKLLDMDEKEDDYAQQRVLSPPATQEPPPRS